MKILIVSTVQTNPTTSGSARFINSYAAMLRDMGHHVYFLHAPLVYRNSDAIKTGIVESRKFWGNDYFLYRIGIINMLKIKALECYYRYCQNYYSQCDVWYIWGLHKYVNALNAKYEFDVCLINYYWLTKLFPKINIPLKGLVSHDCFTFNNERNGTHSLLNLKPNEEAKALQRCPYIFAMQEEEKIYFERLAPKSKVLVSYCIYHFTNQRLAYNHNLVLLSSAFQLNISGLKWFINDIFPGIISAFPDCKLLIGGTICSKLEYLKTNPNIELIGFVEDAANLYAQGDVAINPTYQGTGMKIKTFESIAYNKITMVHPHSMTGIYKKEIAPLFYSTCSKDWVDFLRKVWKYDEFSLSIRKNNEQYINSLNQFVKSQFEIFIKNGHDE